MNQETNIPKSRQKFVNMISNKLLLKNKTRFRSRSLNNSPYWKRRCYIPQNMNLIWIIAQGRTRTKVCQQVQYQYNQYPLCNSIGSCPMPFIDRL